MSRAYNIAAITGVALKDGVDPNLAIADATVESNLNEQAVGDNGTSFGLFQLHQGGELGTLTEAQAFDPVTNATRALSQFENVQKSNPSVTDPGTIAALAQRPANPVDYAKKVDAAMASANGTSSVAADNQPAQPPGGGGLLSTTGTYLGYLNPVTQGLSLDKVLADNATSGVEGDVTSAVGQGLASAGSSFITSIQEALPKNFLVRAGEILGGGILMIVGVIAVAETLGGKGVAKAALNAASTVIPEADAAKVVGAAKGKAVTEKSKATPVPKPKPTPKPKPEAAPAPTTRPLRHTNATLGKSTIHKGPATSLLQGKKS